MKTEHTIDKSARAGRATQIAAMITTVLVAFMWMYFGRLYLIHDPGEWRIANQQLGYSRVTRTRVQVRELGTCSFGVTCTRLRSNLGS
jgi:hypothetical protein